MRRRRPDGAEDDGETDDATDLDVLDDERAESGRSSNPRTVPVGVFVLAVLVAGILGLLAVVALSFDRGGDDDSTDAARSAAGEYAELFLALSHDSYDEWLEDMRSIGTAGFAESVGRREDELRTLLTQAQVTWHGTAVEVFTTSESQGIVSAMVLYDLQVTDQQGPRTIPDQFLRMDLVEGKDGWLVERVLSIPGGSSGLGPGVDPGTVPGAETTTTSLPDG